jgi:hypothetical protein
MSAPPPKPSLAGCLRKIRYSDEAAARAVGSLDCKHYGAPAMGVYQCPHCKGWHLTTTKLVGKRIVTAERV